MEATPKGPFSKKEIPIPKNMAQIDLNSGISFNGTSAMVEVQKNGTLHSLQTPKTDP